MRIEKMQKNVEQYAVQALYISDPLDIFYLVGIELSTGVLLVDKKHSELYVDGRYKEVAQEFSLPSFPLEKLEENMKKYSSIGFDEAKTTFREIRTMQEKGICLNPLDPFVKKLRMQKDLQEIHRIKKSAAILQEGFQYMVGHLKEGVEELELEEVFGDFLKANKCTAAFKPIIAFGENCAKPHHRNSSRRLKNGEVVMFDMGVCHNYYHSDMTRCFAFGSVDPEVEKIYSLVYEAKKRAIESLEMGKKAQDVDAVARMFLKEKGYDEYFVHSLGHGIGLETHEMPYLRKKNEETIPDNCVLTIEPGLYFPKRFGIRIEDMIWIKKEGIENLTLRFDSDKLIHV